MPEHLRDDLRVDRLEQEKRWCRVPQVVESDQRQPGALEYWDVLMPRHVDPDQRLSKLVAEDQVAVAPRQTSCQLFELLAGAMLQQCLYGERRQRHLAAAVLCLRVSKDETPRSLAHGAAHLHMPRAKVRVAPT